MSPALFDPVGGGGQPRRCAGHRRVQRPSEARVRELFGGFRMHGGGRVRRGSRVPPAPLSAKPARLKVRPPWTRCHFRSSFFVLIGVSGLLHGGLALARNVQSSPAGRTRWLVAAFSAGVALAVGALFVCYPCGGSGWICGFPFPAGTSTPGAVGAIRNRELPGVYFAVRGFVDPLAYPMQLVNLVFAFLLPQLALRRWLVKDRASGARAAGLVYGEPLALRRRNDRAGPLDLGASARLRRARLSRRVPLPYHRGLGLELTRPKLASSIQP